MHQRTGPSDLKSIQIVNFNGESFLLTHWHLEKEFLAIECQDDGIKENSGHERLALRDLHSDFYFVECLLYVDHIQSLKS